MRRAFLLVTLLACSKEKPKVTPDAAAPLATADASTPKKTASNLLYTTDAVVAVSSKVDNPKDFPEHLVDGKPETAWNGKTGDLNGWIQLRIPTQAHVDAISITTGFDKKAKNGDDLFAMNHRITKVRVSYAGKPIAEKTLDPNVRTPQAIKLGVPGGDFRIDVLETLPGTKKEWRELTVSELAVWGDPKEAALMSTHLPRVLVGSLDAPTPPKTPPPKLATTPATKAKPHRVANVAVSPSLDAFCKDHTARVAPDFESSKDEYPGFIEPPYCEPSTQAFMPATSPVTEVRTVSITEHSERHDNLALTTPRGVVVTNIILDDEDIRSPGCGGSCRTRQKSVTFEKTSRGTWLVALVDHHCWVNPMPTMDDVEGFSGSSTYTEVAYACLVTTDGDVTCTEWQDAKEAYGAYRMYEDDFDRVEWLSVRKKTVTADGTIVFE